MDEFDHLNDKSLPIPLEAKTPDQRWAEQVSEADEPLKETHIKKEYTLSVAEKSELIKVVGINAFAKQIEILSQQLADNLLNLNILPRVGVTPSQDKRVLYDPEIGRFCVWSTKKVKE